MAKLFGNVTRDRPPPKVLIGARQSTARVLLEAHARFRAGRSEGRRAVLLRCDLGGLDLSRIDLSGADLVECGFDGSNLTGARFVDATLTGSRFCDCLLSGARFAGTDLCRSDFHMADLRGADFSGANLLDARLTGAMLGSCPECGLPTTIDTRILDRIVARRRWH